jgi:hypothetical protein
MHVPSFRIRLQPADLQRINLTDRADVTFWCDKFWCNVWQLRGAVKAVGTAALDVENYLKTNRATRPQMVRRAQPT